VLLIRDPQGRAPAFQGFLQVRNRVELLALQELMQDGRNHRVFSLHELHFGAQRLHYSLNYPERYERTNILLITQIS